MSNKPTPATTTEPNKPGLPESPERGIGDATGQPVVAGTGVQGVIPEAVLEAEAKPAASKTEKAKAKASPKPDVAWFRVKGPGSVKLNGVWHAPGDEMKLPRTEALSVNDYLEEIDGPTDHAD
jgi:hypothetical protein